MQAQKWRSDICPQAAPSKPDHQKAEAILRPVEMLDLKRLARTFTLRTRDGFIANFRPAFIAREEVTFEGESANLSWEPPEIVPARRT